VVQYTELAKAAGRLEFVAPIEAYFKEVGDVFKRYTPIMVDPFFVRKDLAETDDPTCFEELDSSVNFVKNFVSEIAIHKDPMSHWPAILGMANLMDKKRPWTGGELLLPEVAFIVDYGMEDVVLLMGHTTYHSVLPIVPGDKVKGAVRCSISHHKRRKK
jgi:hypothetical protein